MSSSTALLPKTKKDDHPIFLRVCHSPWTSINQKSLMFIRGLIAGYILVVFCMLIYYEKKRTDHGWLMPFEIQNISYFMQLIYFVATFVSHETQVSSRLCRRLINQIVRQTWTTMHLYYPHHGGSSPSLSSNIQTVLSPPRQNSSTGNRALFSIFYTATLVFPGIVTLGYWAFLTPHGAIGETERKF
jgi:hypothetical protein